MVVWSFRKGPPVAISKLEKKTNYGGQIMARGKVEESNSHLSFSAAECSHPSSSFYMSSTYPNTGFKLKYACACLLSVYKEYVRYTECMHRKSELY